MKSFPIIRFESLKITYSWTSVLAHLIARVVKNGVTIVFGIPSVATTSLADFEALLLVPKDIFQENVDVFVAIESLMRVEHGKSVENLI